MQFEVSAKQVPWDTAFVDGDVDYTLARWQDLFLACIEEFVPKITTKDPNKPPWIDAEVMQLIRKKNKMRRKFNFTNSAFVWGKFRQIRHQVKKLIKSNKREHLKELGDSFKDNPRRFWSYYKSITKSSRIPTVVKHGPLQASRPLDQANLYNANLC